jgi:sodium transport system permease protein
MRGGRVVFRKEVVDNLRDRRTLLAALAYPLLGPAIMMLIFTTLVRVTAERQERPLRLPVVGAEQAPNLVAYLRAQGVQVADAPADAEAAVRNGDEDVVLRIPAGFGAAWRAGRPADVELVVDPSRQPARVAVERTRRLLNGYGEKAGALRLLARGISPSVTQALVLTELDVSTPQSQAALFLNILPYFMVFSVFIGGLYVAVDATAGERERGSLEALLINPVPRWQILLGKMGATIVFTLVAVTETVLAFAVMLHLFSLEDLGLAISVSAGSMLAILLVTLPMVLPAVALQMCIGVFTRSAKEAQNYLSFLPLIPALPGLLLAFVPVKPSLLVMLIPTFGQQVLINQILRGEPVNPAWILVTSVVTLALGVVLTWVAVRLFRREQVLSSR